MTDDIDELIDMMEIEMDSTIDHLKKELSKLRAGKVSPSLVSGIMVNYYDSPTPMSQVANIVAKDSKTLEIKPWEKSMLAEIEKGIFEANIGITPMNNGESVLIVMPPVTEERRKDLVKRAKSLAEDSKVHLRQIRHKGMDVVKKNVKDGYPEDAGKRKEDEIQKKVNEYGDKVNSLISAKEKDIMTI